MAAFMQAKITLRAATTSDDAEVVRRLRNAGRVWFGNDREIGREEQLSWWAAKTATEGFACMIAGEPPVGYGMLRRLDDGRRWVSLAVDPAMRGRGVGTEIYRALLTLAASGESLYAGIRRDNAPSIAAARRAGYEIDDAVPAPASDPSLWIVLRGDDYPVEVIRRARRMSVHPSRLMPHEGSEGCVVCGAEPGEQHDLATHDAESDLVG